MAVDYLRPFLSHTNMLDIKEEGPSVESKKTIHSGHFMVSRVHEPNADDDEEEAVSPFNDDNKGFDFLNAVKKTSTTYNFGNAIDESLTKLFECMTLAYSGTITSPRWKQFRGLHVSQKQRIRLNNLIWREWHMQYIYQKRPMVCQFAMPLSDDIHSKPEAVVLEGKYWKRRLDAVTAEYKKWRRYYKDQAQRLQFLGGFSGADGWPLDTSHLSEWELLERVKDVTFIPCLGSGMKGEAEMITQGQSNTDLALLQRDIMEMDFTNDFFNSLNNTPFSFPNPRELNQLGRSDLIQPGLVQLQPNNLEFMDIDSLQLDLLSAKIPATFGHSYNASTGSSFLADTPNNVDMAQESDTLLNFLTNTQASGNSQMAMQVGQLPALPQQPQTQQQPQQQIISPLTQFMTANSSTGLIDPSSQGLAFQLSNTSDDNHNGNGGQPQLQQQQQFELDHSPTIFVEGNQAYTLVTSGGMNTNINNGNNIHMHSLNASGLQKVIGGDGGGAISSEFLNQMLKQEVLKQEVQKQQQQQQERQQQQRQRLLQRQQQQQQRAQQQRLQLRSKGPTLAPKAQAQAQQPQPIQQDLLQQLLQQHQEQQQFQQSPSAQSPLLAKSLTAASPSTSPLHNTLSSTSPQRTNTHGVISTLTTSPSPPGLPQPALSPQQRKGGRQARASNKQTHTTGRRDSSGGASAVMSDLARTAAGKKKDGPFAVPQAKPVNTPRKNRTIAPAPVPITPYVPSMPQHQTSVLAPSTTSSSSQESYLAQLLKNGTYTGAMINVKKDSLQPKQQIQPGGRAQASPIQTTTNLYQQIRSAAASPPSATAIVGQISPQPGADLVTVPIGSQLQAASLFAGTSIGSIDLTSITPQTLANVVLPVSLGSQQMEAISATQGMVDNQQHQASGFAQLTEEKVPSVPTSPRIVGAASPPMFSLKASPSPPQPSMDTSNSLGEPASPLSMVAMSPSTQGDPTSPAPLDSDLIPDSRRAAHLSAEQKRRWNLKTGFDMLQQLVPSLSQNPRVSKATMLQKTAEYCKKLKAERLQMQKEAAVLKREIESLNISIGAVQAQLPETGVPMTRQRKDQMREMFDDYVCQRTKENWKFWIFSVIMNPLYESYCSSVSTTSMEELCKTSLTWLDQSCSLVTLRPNVLNSLTKLCTSTSILTEPLKVKEQALLAVEKQPEKPK